MSKKNPKNSQSPKKPSILLYYILSILVLAGFVFTYILLTSSAPNSNLNSILVFLLAADVLALIALIVLALWRRLAGGVKPLYLSPIAKLYQECDPEPLLAQSQRMLARKRKPAGRLQWLMYQNMALFDLGRYQEATQQLLHIFEEFPSLPRDAQLSVYYNLCANAFMQKDIPAVFRYHEQAEKIRQVLPPRVQEMAKYSFMLQRAQLEYCKENYSYALELLSQAQAYCKKNQPGSPYLTVYFGYYHGLMLYKTGDLATAAKKLYCVAYLANKLYIGTLAKQVYEEIKAAHPEVIGQ